MLQAKEPRDQVLFTRVKKENKEFFQKKAKEAGMEDAPFMDMLLEQLRTTAEGKKFMEVKNAGHKGSVSKRAR